MKKISVLIGSNRQESFTRKFALGVIKLAPSDLNLNIVEIDKLPFFNQDLENTPPAEWTKFRESISNSDGVLIFTPEYNRSFSALIKNAIDVGSRPYGKGALTGKPAAIISCTPGALGGVSSNQQLRLSCDCVGMVVMGTPEMYIAGVHKLVDKDGNIVEESKNFVSNFLNVYNNWISKFIKNI